jgi:cation diffusion facilitator family transporter
MAGCGCGCEIEIQNKAERKVLWILLAINALMFFVEFSVGLLAESTGLIADSLDMLADAGVYGISLYAVGKTLRDKAHAASVSGVFQILLSMAVVADVIRKYIVGSEPLSDLMMVVGLLALTANVICLALISKHRNGEVHMRASWIFSTNDVLANLGVISAGALVHFTGSRLPDLIIGLMISGLVLYGGIRIVGEARKSYAMTSCADRENRGIV